MQILHKMMVGLLLLGATQLSAQSGATQVSNQNPEGHNAALMREGNPPTPLNGNGLLGPAYHGSECGLDYTTATNRLGQRFFPAGVPQPATFNIAGIPAGAIIVKAFVWCDASGNGVPITIDVQNPSFITTSVPMTLVGTDGDKCWGYASSTTYRADVTSTITGNGPYEIKGFPVDPGAATHTNDVDGATMIVIWRDPTATWQGDLHIWDGALVRLGSPVSQTVGGFQACGGKIFKERAFIGVGDLQGLGSQLEINGVGGYPALEDWWDFVEVPTTVAPGATSSSFGNVVSGDCYNIALYGLYFQSDCQTCTYPCDPKPDFKWDGCNPVVFDGYNTGVSPVLSWFWDFGDGGTSTLEDPTHNYALPGTYNVCLTIITKNSDGKTCCEQICHKIDVCPPQPCSVQPNFFWAMSVNPFEVIFSDATTFTGGSICNYQMSFGDATPVYNGPTMPASHVYPGPGAYIVCVTVTVCLYDASGNVIQKCEERTCRDVVVNRQHSMRTGNNNPVQEINVFPNPANSQINVTVADPNATIVRIMNASGQEVAVAKSVGKNMYRADLTNLAAGVYFVTVQSADGSIKKEMFVKE